MRNGAARGRRRPDAPRVHNRLGPILRSAAASATAVRNGRIRRAVLAFLAFNTVEMATWTTILVYAYAATGPASVGLVAVAQLLPSAVAAPVLAGIGDRFPRAQVLFGWFVVQALAILAVATAIFFGGPPILVYVLSGLATVTLTQTRPAVSSLLPDLADTPDELTAGNALCSMSTGLGGFIGPLAVGVILAVADPGAAFLAAGLTLFAGAGLLVGLRPHPADEMPAARARTRRRAVEPVGIEPVIEPVGIEPVGPDPRAILGGLREVARDPDLLVVMALLAGQLVIFGGLEVLLVLLAIDLLGIGESGAGYLIGALGLGAILGGAAAFALVGRRRLAPWLGVAAVIVGLPVALIGVSPGAGSAAILLVMSGIGFAILEVAGQTLLQRITPDAVRARVFGILEGLLLVGEALGSAIVPPIALVLGLQNTAIALGLLLPLLATLAVVRFGRIDARVAIPAVELRALVRVPMLRPLGPAALELLARHLVRVAVPAGTVVIREGDAGDRWYLVRDGRFTVTQDGRRLRELGTGDAFGEIALLRDIPRTATVEATTGGMLWALDRHEFLAGVTGSPAALVEAERVVASHLA